VRIRDVNATDVVKLAPVVKQLQERGMPNYFGEQRFGRRHDNHLTGAALLRGDNAGVLKLLLGTPNPRIDDAQALGARKAFDREEFEQAMRLFPRRAGMERRVLARFVKTKNAASAVKAIDEKLRRLWVSAVQSEMFNQVAARRVAALDQLMQGDLAYKHDSGAVFRVEDLAAEQPRCAAFEVSPSGPLVGYRMTLPEGEPLLIEQEVLAAASLTPEDFRVEGRHKVKGNRRPLRVRPRDVELSAGVDVGGAYITAAFSLPAGSFATVFLRELMKVEE